MWWRCANYFIIATWGYIPRDNKCMCVSHLCFRSVGSDCVGVCGNVCCVAAVVKDSVFSLRVLKYVFGKGCDGFCVLCLYCEAWTCRCSCM